MSNAPKVSRLKSRALNLTSSTIMGVASTAPAYSLAATLGFIIMNSGDHAAGTLLLAFVPILLLAIAYREFNKRFPDCGTTFTWVSKAFGPWAGWLGGWCVIVSGLIVMANLGQIAGSFSLLLFGQSDLASNTVLTTIIGSSWVALLAYFCYLGIQLTVKVQFWMLIVEMAILAAFVVSGLLQVYSGAPGTTMPELNWLSPFGGDIHMLISGLLLAIFIYWGWETTLSVNEETEDPDTTPGKAALLSTLILLVTYVLVAITVTAYNADGADNIFAGIAQPVLGSFGDQLISVAILFSAAASILTTILPSTRTMLSMAQAGAIPRRLAKIHPKHRTPHVATVVFAVCALSFYALLSLVSDNILADSIASVGISIALYYGLTGLACAWYFRRSLSKGVRTAALQVVLPGIGGSSLILIFLLSLKEYIAPDYGEVSIGGIGLVGLIGIGSIALGFTLLILCRLFLPNFFKTATK